MARARLRVLLSSSGMAIGIAAITLLFGVGAGSEKAFRQALETMGKNLLSVGAQRQESDALRGASKRFQTLTLGDWRAIGDELDSVDKAAPIVMNNFQLRYRGESVNMTVIGTTPEFEFTNTQLLVAGRFLDDIDLEANARVAVIGSEAARQLFRGEQPLGERILVDGAPYIVIGLLAEKGVDPTGSPQDDRILVPVTTAQRRLLGVDFVDRIFVQAISKEKMDTAIADVRTLLRARHGLNDSVDDDFTIRDQAGLLGTLDETDRTLTRFLAGTAALTLGLASIGLLAVSLLSVQERQHEIGLRLALGALPSQILVQFLSEAVINALLGATGGLLVGAFGIIVGQWLIGWQLTLNGWGVAYAFLVSLALSLLFGAYPALRAARLDPIAALRSA